MSMKDVFFAVFSWNYKKHSRLGNVFQRMFTFSFPIYMALISGIIYHLFSLWCSYFLENEVYTIEYKNGQFNQCNQTINMPSEGNVTNFRNYFAEYKSHDRSKLLLLASLIFLLFHVIESLTNCHNGVASLSEFVYGPDSQECIEEKEEAIQLDDLDPDEVQKKLRQDILVPRQTPKSKSICFIYIFRGLMSFLGFAFLVLLYLSPMTFHLLQKIDDSERGIVRFIRMLKYFDKSNSHSYFCSFLAMQNN